MTETNIANSQLYELAKEMWNSLEDHHVGQEERVLELKAETEKVREAAEGPGQDAPGNSVRPASPAESRQEAPGPSAA
jgi:hypothetical protein